MARIMARWHREGTDHTDWCARDHRCGLAEHRSPPTITDGRGGRAVLTRVRAATTEYAEIHIRIPLHHHESGARWQLDTALRLLRHLLTAVAAHPAALPADDRRALTPDRRTRS